MRTLANLFKSYWLVALGMAASVVTIGTVFVMCDRASDTGRAPGDQIRVVSAAASVAGQPASGRVEGQGGASMSAELNADEAGRLVERYLPALRNVRSACDVEVCTIAAEPVAAGEQLDQQALSQLVQEDMPRILGEAHHGLTEPIQIEEIGPDQYRLQFRVSRHAQ